MPTPAPREPSACGSAPTSRCPTSGPSSSTASAGILHRRASPPSPSPYAGDTFLLPSVAVVVLGGTSLLGGRGFPLATVVAAVFLQQLTQLVDVLGVSPAISPLVQAAALAVGVSLYTVNWGAVWASLTRRATTRRRRVLIRSTLQPLAPKPPPA